MHFPISRSPLLIATAFLLVGPLLLAWSYALGAALTLVAMGQLPDRVSLSFLWEGPFAMGFFWLMFAVTPLGPVLFWGPTLLAATLYWGATAGLAKHNVFPRSLSDLSRADSRG